ncbi:MAG TPA: NAD(P)/FAD-dependent oxidoreductase [Thermoanaerobaculia bacterium]
MGERIVIVGSGLVGSLLAVYLARRGQRVELFERRADLRRRRPDRGRSINLTLCERGLRALDRVGVGQRVRRLAIPAYGRVIHGRDGAPVFQPYGCRREAIHSISRNALNETLLDFAEQHPGIHTHFGKKCRSIDPEGPRAVFEDRERGTQTEVAASRIFGADGAHSVVRRQLREHGRLRCARQYLEQGYKELDLPPRPDGGWALDEHAIHVWPRGRHMLIGFANLDGSFTMALHLPFEGEMSFGSVKDEADLRALFCELFPGAEAVLPRLVEDYFRRPATPMVTVRCFPWTYGDKVALAGDSAHAIVPSYGQGANFGFEGCAVIDECLEAARGDWHEAFQRYERRHHPNAETIADLALEHFEVLQEHVRDPRFLLRTRLERRIDELYPETYSALYSLISFTTTPYTEARRIDREARGKIDRLLELEGVEAMLDRGEMDPFIWQAFGVASHARNKELRRQTQGVVQWETESRSTIT